MGSSGTETACPIAGPDASIRTIVSFRSVRTQTLGLVVLTSGCLLQNMCLHGIADIVLILSVKTKAG